MRRWMRSAEGGGAMTAALYPLMWTTSVGAGPGSEKGFLLGAMSRCPISSTMHYRLRLQRLRPSMEKQ